VLFRSQYPAAIDTLRDRRAIKFTTDPPDPYAGAGSGDLQSPLAFELLAPHPNPFNSRAWITFSLPADAEVGLTLYNLEGRLVRNLAGGNMAAGSHRLMIDAGELATGMYLLRLESGGQRLQRNVVVVR